MTHTYRDHDGMNVLVVTDMNRRFDEEGKLVSSKKVNLELVHAKEIAKYYGLPLRTTGKGDNEIPGVWALVYANEFGQRVPYNGEETRIGDRHVRHFKIIKDAAGNPVETKEIIKNLKTHHEASGKATAIPLVEETDDGMYVKLADMLEYAKIQGLTKGGGFPGSAATKAHVDAGNDRLAKMETILEGLLKLMTNQVVTSTKGAK